MTVEAVAAAKRAGRYPAHRAGAGGRRRLLWRHRAVVPCQSGSAHCLSPGGRGHHGVHRGAAKGAKRSGHDALRAAGARRPVVRAGTPVAPVRKWMRFATAFNWCEWTLPVLACLVMVPLSLAIGAGLDEKAASLVLVGCLGLYGTLAALVPGAQGAGPVQFSRRPDGVAWSMSEPWRRSWGRIFLATYLAMNFVSPYISSGNIRGAASGAWQSRRGCPGAWRPGDDNAQLLGGRPLPAVGHLPAADDMG